MKNFVCVSKQAPTSSPYHQQPSSKNIPVGPTCSDTCCHRTLAPFPPIKPPITSHVPAKRTLPSPANVQSSKPPSPPPPPSFSGHGGDKAQPISGAVPLLPPPPVLRAAASSSSSHAGVPVPRHGRVRRGGAATFPLLRHLLLRLAPVPRSPLPTVRVPGADGACAAGRGVRQGRPRRGAAAAARPPSAQAHGVQGRPHGHRREAARAGAGGGACGRCRRRAGVATGAGHRGASPDAGGRRGEAAGHEQGVQAPEAAARREGAVAVAVAGVHDEADVADAADAEAEAGAHYRHGAQHPQQADVSETAMPSPRHATPWRHAMHAPRARRRHL